MKKKLSIVIALVLALSLILVPAVVSANPGPIIGFWQPNVPTGGTVEYSTTRYHSPGWSVYLEALKASSPADSNEIYVGQPTGVTNLNSLTNVSFWYYAPTGGDPVPPQIDVWLDTDTNYSYGPPPTGDDAWLLGRVANVTTFDTWVEVTHDDIQWIKAAGGQIYGMGSAGLTAAKGDYGADQVLAIGIQAGSQSGWAKARSGDQQFYVDDFTINAITYDLGPTSGVGLTAEVPSIVAISVTPTGIDFGTLYPGQTSATTTLTVENIGTVTIDVDASVAPTGKVFDYLQLDTVQVPITDLITNLASGTAATAINARLVVPQAYSPQGPETATLIFIATPTP